MALVAVAPVVFLLQRVGSGVPEREWIALVVVIRLVGGQGVVELELEPRAGRLPKLDGHAVVPRPGGALNYRQSAESGCTTGGKGGGPGTGCSIVTEDRIVGVEEAGQVIGPRVSVADPCRNTGTDLPLVTHRRGKRPRVLEVLVEDEDSRLERSTARCRKQLAIHRRGTEEGSGG